jgi:hypothetical protein
MYAINGAPWCRRGCRRLSHLSYYPECQNLF